MQSFFLGDGAKGRGGAIILQLAFRKTAKCHFSCFLAASEERKQCRECRRRAIVELDPQAWTFRLRIAFVGEVETARQAYVTAPWSAVQNRDPSPCAPWVLPSSSIAVDRLQ
ncbi:MAG: hypothetical protein WC729_08945 [Sphingomonas sp.]|uniref:hypothetical protein n=1 Tax=Sphingomonas sp. TaxID=28214 RepID=UPI003562EE07